MIGWFCGRTPSGLSGFSPWLRSATGAFLSLVCFPAVKRGDLVGTQSTHRALGSAAKRLVREIIAARSVLPFTLTGIYLQYGLQRYLIRAHDSPLEYSVFSGPTHTRVHNLGIVPSRSGPPSQSVAATLSPGRDVFSCHIPVERALAREFDACCIRIELDTTDFRRFLIN